MPKPTTAFQDAAAELAVDSRDCDFPSAITTTAARRYIDAGVIAAWVGHEIASQAPEQVLAEVCASRITSDDAKTLLCSIAIGYDTKVQAIMQAALIEQVARDLARTAQAIVDEGDDEDNRPITRDDVSDPFLAEQRSFTRRHNASLRAVR